MQPENSEEQKSILITAACIRGIRHKNEGKPCQDAWISYPISGGGLVIAAADGLSSASHSDQGAMVAVHVAGKSLASAFAKNQDVSDRKESIRDAVNRARDVIIARAVDEGTTPASYASTLIITVFDHGRMTIGHIGDGIVVGVQEGKTIILSPPGPGEYVNETACLVQDDWEKNLRLADFIDIDCCIIATDGCQDALSIRKGGVYSPHDPFILPLTSFIRERLAAGIDPTPDITALLLSPRMERLSGDDKTLIVLMNKNSAPS